jgi:Tol biopolymer transport system component
MVLMTKSDGKPFSSQYFCTALRRPKSFVHEIYFSFFYSNVESDFSGGPGPRCKAGAGGSNDSLRYPEESHFKNIQQLTFGGDNAEAYWSFDSKSVVFQRTSVKDGVACDQIFYGKLPVKNGKFTYKLVSTGKGRTTCAFFTKDGKHIIYASTHEGSEACPPIPDRPNMATGTSGLFTAASIFTWLN